MSRLLFENSKIAMGFAGLTLVGAAIFAGTSGSTGFIGAPGEGEAGDGAAAAPTRQVAPKDQPGLANQPEIADFAPDEELIDDALGFDPAPRERFELADPDELDQPDASPAVNDASPGANSSGASTPRPPSPPRQRTVVITGKDGGIKPIQPEPNNELKPLPPRPGN